MKRLIVDLDSTLTIDDPGLPYDCKRPNTDMIAMLKKYKANGFDIVINTARNMRTYNGSVGKINAYTLPIIVDWLKQHDVPFDEIFVGKPWCGDSGFYIDDKTIRPNEFLTMNYEDICRLLEIDLPVPTA